MDWAAALVPDGAFVQSDGAPAGQLGVSGGDAAEKVAEREEEGQDEGDDGGGDDGAE